MQSATVDVDYQIVVDVSASGPSASVGWSLVSVSPWLISLSRLIAGWPIEITTNDKLLRTYSRPSGRMIEARSVDNQYREWRSQLLFIVRFRDYLYMYVRADV